VKRRRIHDTEPTALVGGISSLLGFLVLAGTDVSTLQGLGTAVGISGTQAVMTRQGVFSPASVAKLRRGEGPASSLASLISKPGGSIGRYEPALGVGLLTLIGGFLVQFFSGVDLVQALTTSTAISGIQGFATRGRVYSPASAQRAAAAGVLARRFTPAERRAALRRQRVVPG
jgi:hypothetical protein